MTKKVRAKVANLVNHVNLEERNVPATRMNRWSRAIFLHAAIKSAKALAVNVANVAAP